MNKKKIIMIGAGMLALYFGYRYIAKKNVQVGMPKVGNNLFVTGEAFHKIKESH